MILKTFISLIFLLPLIACSSTQKKQEVAMVKSFSVPEPPTVFTTSKQKAEFIVTHYWDNFNFADTTLITRDDYTEQAFADFANLLSNVPIDLAQRGIDTLMSRSMVEGEMYTHFMSMSEKYLYDPNSPFRNEDLYIAVLRNVLANERLDEITKVRPQYQLDLALKNRVGTKATNFTYTTKTGGKATLHQATGDTLMLFFFRPDCETCKQVKQYVESQGIDKLVKIIWVDPSIDTHIDTLYDLRASPTLYLLNKNKVVLLKDAPIEQIETYLKTLKQ